MALPSTLLAIGNAFLRGKERLSISLLRYIIAARMEKVNSVFQVQTQLSKLTAAHNAQSNMTPAAV